MQLYDLNDVEERVILVGVQEGDGEDAEESVEELAELSKTAGAQVVGTVIQKRERIHPGTYVGKGKMEELKMLLTALDATGIICDDELSPVQMNNLQQELDCKVMDRTLLILDIFADHASTSEGKIQVELAQLRYRAVRLVGLGNSLSRLGGGIGTRGPGEKKLEMDRRLIKERISQLKRELEQVKRHRELTSGGQEKRAGHDSRYRGIHQRRKIHSSEHTHRRRCFVGGQTVCHSGSHNENAGAIRGNQDLPYRYRRIYPETAPSPDRGI